MASLVIAAIVFASCLSLAGIGPRSDALEPSLQLGSMATPRLGQTATLLAKRAGFLICRWAR